MTKYGHGMASSHSSSSSSSATLPATLGLGDASPLSITCHKLNGHNFLQWSQSVMMFICGRGKDELLLETSSRPETSDPKFKAWKSENNLVMSWLINSMAPEIGENFLLYRSAKEIWEAARETYSSRDNTAELFAT